MKKKKFTLEEHQSLGEELYIINLRLERISCELDWSYGRKLYRLAAKASCAIGVLRNQLDIRVCEENPQPITNNPARAYYCANRCSHNTIIDCDQIVINIINHTFN